MRIGLIGLIGLISAAAALAVDVILGRIGSVTWTGTGTDRIAVWGGGGGTGQIWCVEFDGQNYAATSATNAFTSPDQLTVEAWIRTDAEWPGNGCIIGCYNNSGGEYGWQIRFNADPSVFTDWGLEDGSWYGGLDGTISTGQWHHVALTYDAGGHLRLWVDGELAWYPTDDEQNEITVPHCAVIEEPVTFGFDLGYGSTYRVRAARISSVCRYSGPFTPPQTLTADENTIALWLFQEGTGTTVHDSVGGFHAEFGGDPLPVWVEVTP